MAQTTTTPKHVEGQLVHTEFITNDPKALANFLAKNFNWKFEAMKMPGGTGDYHMFTTPGGTAGGVTAPPAPKAPTGTYAYINVTDIKATAKKVEKAGATIVTPPMEIPGSGWFFQWTYKGSPVISCYQGTNSRN